MMFAHLGFLSQGRSSALQRSNWIGVKIGGPEAEVAAGRHEDRSLQWRNNDAPTWQTKPRQRSLTGFPQLMRVVTSLAVFGGSAFVLKPASSATLSRPFAVVVVVFTV